jgi:arginine deiminase
MTLNSKIKLLTVLILLITTITVAQKEEEQPFIISEDVVINKYHSQDELENMQKGQLMILYNRRIEVLIKILPNIAFTSKPDITMSSMGIPYNKENRNALKDNIDAATTYFKNTLEFQEIVLPYSDKDNLISAILFYEETLKALHTYDDFK